MSPAIEQSRSRVRFHETTGGSMEGENEGISEVEGIVGPSFSAPRFDLHEDPSFWKENNIQVIIRLRPLSNSEISTQGHNKCIRQESCQSITWIGHPESRFTFDLVADEHVSQENLFKVAGVPMVDNCMAGYNSCMFAYGQTGSGKTHTMLGDIENGTRRHNPNCGMTPRVFEYLFSQIQKEKERRKDEKLRFICKCSFLEIYNEQIFDLLNPNSTNLQIREDAKKGVYVENLTESEVSSARDAVQQLIQGAANRKVAATNMNRASSRSHSVFTCVIESKWEVQGITHHRFAQLNLVDLAGSERQKSSGAEGERLKEATNINKSLSTLGLVIMNLVGLSNKKSLHVPYRDSKLTFLLQDSLGGNSKTIMIANISPANCCALETLSTLKFAQRAKYIKNNAIVNEDASGDVLSMRLQIQQLKNEVDHLRGLVNNGPTRLENDGLNGRFESPGILKFDVGQGSFSPLTFDKRLSQRKEYEAALVAALRRDQDKEASLRAMDAAKRTAEELAAQRTEEVRNLKMMLKFRDASIKRLQAVVSGKLSVESHLSTEKEELLKENNALRSQLDRNPDVTRFAMENLQLKEELRRLHAFVEEGERERMNEQITVLQDKLLEALDWKLMHEKDPFFAQDMPFSLEPSNNDENEFLRLQAIQNEREIESLRKKLNLALEAKENLERRVEELVSQLEEEKTCHSLIEETRDREEACYELHDAETELKTMVDAIAAASQREAEAHETAIALAKENEELRIQLNARMDNNSNSSLHDPEMQDMHEENEKLLVLYEQAMLERDESNRLLHQLQAKEATLLPRKQIEEMLQLVRGRLHLVQNKLSSSEKSVEYLQLLEKASGEVDDLSSGVRLARIDFQPKEENINAVKCALSWKQREKATVENKYLDLISALEGANLKVQCLGEKEARTRAKIDEQMGSLMQQKEELRCLEMRKEELSAAYRKAKQTESKLRSRIDRLKLSLQDAEALRKERENVLLEVNNLVKTDVSSAQMTSLNLNFGGKASELLKSEEERTKLFAEMNQLREQLALVKKEITALTKSCGEVDSKFRILEEGIKDCSVSLREAELELGHIVEETETVCSVREGMRAELDGLLLDYQQCVFEEDLREESDALVQQDERMLDELESKLDSVMRNLKDVLHEQQRVCMGVAPRDPQGSPLACYVSELLAKELADIHMLVAEAKHFATC